MHISYNDDTKNGADQGTTPFNNVWMISTIPTSGFHFNLYPRTEMLANIALYGAGYLDQFAHPNNYVAAQQIHWGDAGYSPDHVITPSLGALIQNYIDELDYDESGTPLAIRLHTPDPDAGHIRFTSSQNLFWKGMKLTIEYVEPQPGQASNPDPVHLATNVAVDKVLSWTSGAYAGTQAVTHDVYFGTDPDPSGNFIGNQPGNTYDPGGLVEGQTYYWRIDEVGEFGTTQGAVWSFTVVILVYVHPKFDADTNEATLVEMISLEAASMEFSEAGAIKMMIELGKAIEVEVEPSPAVELAVESNETVKIEVESSPAVDTDGVS
jgi:hypothetical protein